MAPNIPRLRAYLDRLTNATLTDKTCDICDAVMPSGTSTCQSCSVDAVVTPASDSESRYLADEEGEFEASVSGDLEEREAMALEGGVPPAYAKAFAILQVARPAGVDEPQWLQAINDAGVFLDAWGDPAERLGWTARDVIGPQFTPAALAWFLNGASVIRLTPTNARLSDGRTFVRPGDGKT